MSSLVNLIVSALLLMLSVLAQNVHYVRPDESPPAACPGQPCLTLDQYAQQAEMYFVTGVNFIFLVGNHSLHATVNFTGCSDIILRSNSTPCQITYENEAAVILLRKVTNFTIEGLTFRLPSNSTEQQISALKVVDSKKILISNSLFQGSRRATISLFSVITVTSCLFVGNAGNLGGALYASNSNLTLISNTFMSNKADLGGAVYAYACNINLTTWPFENSTETLKDNVHEALFYDNKATMQGGAMYLENCNLLLNGEVAVFRENLAGEGSAIYSFFTHNVFSTSQIYFIKNHIRNASATFWKNDVCFLNTHALYILSGSLKLFGNAVFMGNYGGGISCYDCDAFLNEKVEFVNNTACFGGAMHLARCNFSATHLTFRNNTGSHGSAIYIALCNNINGTSFKDVTASGNSGSAFYNVISQNNKVAITGIARFINNTGEFGGGIFIEDSVLSLNSVEFVGNTAVLGGAIHSLYGDITFEFSNQRTLGLFASNKATSDGGAIYVTDTSMIVKNGVNFTSNSAKNGGALYFSRGTLHFQGSRIFETLFYASNNSASEYGGAVYYEDAPTTFQCNLADGLLPQCFINIRIIQFTSKFNLAGQEGDFIYGGLLDRCLMERLGEVRSIPEIQFAFIQSFYGSAITSRAYQLCFCQTNLEYDCSGVKHLIGYRGQTLRVFLVAFDQMRKPVSTQVTAIVSNSSRLPLNQSPQDLAPYCSPLLYNLYSRKSQEELVLYPDGPCHDTGLARAVVEVMLLPCPDGFTKSREQCICEERLQVYNVDCSIDDSAYITKDSDPKFWMSGLYENGTYQGLILFKICPFEYCTNNTVNVTLDNPDTQCALNRGGVLCGQCTANYSLTLGSDHCQVCSNAYLALLLPFAAAGLALVVFLTFLRLTVATGMINSVILYANIVQVNRNIFISNSSRNVLTVFLAWMNLDLGFKTCFYDGMDAYAQTWLQFAFPVYVWTLIALMIVTSRYSIIVSKLIGSNPIAVLATLLLMSYTKILKVVIEVYSYVKLDYSDNKTVTVWLKDSNVPYLQSKHLLLTVVTSLVLVFFFLPYTLLLLFGHKLYRFTGRKGFRWFSKIKPLLDSYYAPYKRHTRYWTGFLLLVRCALYIVFSYNSLGTTDKSLLAIIIVFTIITAISGYLFAGKIYANFYINIVEVLSYQNLVFLSAATLAGVYSPALVYTLVGIVLVIMIGITVYHFHLHYTAKSAMWLKVKVMLGSALAAVKTSTVNRDNQQPAPVETGVVCVKPGNVSKTVIELREPLLENN